MRVCALFGGLWAVAACSGNTFENPEQAAAGGAGRGGGDAGREIGSGGTAGTISLDAALHDTGTSDGLVDCSPRETLQIESEDGGAWCSVPLPKFPMLDRNKINVTFARKDGETSSLYFIRSPEDCDSDATAFAPAWYYYESADTARIGFCPKACVSISSEGYGMVTVMQGCENWPRPP